ncbi:uncharacterized protein TNCV_4104941 [Trichonephila clavipes]|nr:uncharacterized protein TNCV_4104941 [Trichonephila clavipes]
MRNARGFNVWPEEYFSGSENVTEFLEGIDNQIKLLEIPSEVEKPWLFHVLADLEHPCIPGIDFIGGSKIILDLDLKSLAIPDSQIDKVVKTVEGERKSRNRSF